MQDSDVRGARNRDGGSPSSAASGLETLLVASGINAASEYAQASLLSAALQAAARVPSESPLRLRPTVNANLQARVASLSAAAGVPSDSQSILSLLARASATSNLLLPVPFHQLGTSNVATATNPLAKLLTSAGYTDQHGISTELSHSLNTKALIPSRGAPVRPDQIEAAMRSKPQRGRKRENLNEYERMELTRTRNREHAKSTRVRKKARYEELLEAEEQWKDHLHWRALNDKRKATIQAFIVMQERRLRSKLDSVTSQQKRSSGRTLVSLDSSSEAPAAVHDIMDDSATFLYDENRKQNPKGEWREEMDDFDEWLATRVANCLGNAATTMLSLTIQGGPDQGVALNELRSGFAQIDLTVASLKVMQALLRFEFVPSSHSTTLSLVQWCTLEYAAGTEEDFERTAAVRRMPDTPSSNVRPIDLRDSLDYAVMSGQRVGGCSQNSQVSCSRVEASEES